MAQKMVWNETDDIHGETSEASNAMQLKPVDEVLSPFETLNDDCLMELFDRLEIIDLFKMFEVNKRCCRIIKDNRFEIKKLFNLPELRKAAKVEWIFEIFGKRITKLKIAGEDMIAGDAKHSWRFDLIGLLKTYDAGQIAELTIGSHCPGVFPERTLNRFLDQFPMENIQKLVVNDKISYGHWLQLSTKQNIEHLSIWVINEYFSNDFETFLMTHPNLKTFRFKTASYDRNEFKILAKYAPKLENFGKISIREKNYVNKFTQLKCLELEIIRVDGDDLFKILDCVANKQMLEALVIDSWAISIGDCENPIEPTMMKQFTSLTTLYLYLIFNGSLQQKFLRSILPHFTSVTKVVLWGSELHQTHIIQTLQLLKNVRVIVINKPIQEQRPTEFYEKLVESWRQKHADTLAYPIKIRLNGNMVKEWKSKLGEKYDENIVVLEATSEFDFKYDDLLNYDSQ